MSDEARHIAKLFIDANTSNPVATVTQTGRWRYTVDVSAGISSMYTGVHWGRKRAHVVAQRKLAQYVDALRRQRQWDDGATVIRSVDDG